VGVMWGKHKSDKPGVGECVKRRLLKREENRGGTVCLGQQAKNKTRGKKGAMGRERGGEMKFPLEGGPSGGRENPEWCVAGKGGAAQRTRSKKGRKKKPQGGSQEKRWSDRRVLKEKEPPTERGDAAKEGNNSEPMGNKNRKNDGDRNVLGLDLLRRGRPNPLHPNRKKVKKKQKRVKKRKIRKKVGIKEKAPWKVKAL